MVDINPAPVIKKRMTMRMPRHIAPDTTVSPGLM